MGQMDDQDRLMPAASASTRTQMAELGAFLLVGGSGAVLFVVLSTLAVALVTGIPAWIISACCYAACIPPVYLGHRRFSFESDLPHRVAFPRYLAVQVTAIGLAAMFSYICYGVLGLPGTSSAVLVAVLTAGVNFVVLRGWAFAHKR